MAEDPTDAVRSLERQFRPLVARLSPEQRAGAREVVASFVALLSAYHVGAVFSLSAALMQQREPALSPGERHLIDIYHAGLAQRAQALERLLADG